VAGLGKRYLTQAEFICGIGKGQRRRGFPRWNNYMREREMEKHDACVPCMAWPAKIVAKHK
jgi:hypothetical protein